MKYTDITIIGGGLAGATAAAMLGRAGVAVIMVDPHLSYPPDFRIEKLGGDGQIERLRKTGLAEAVLREATHDGVNWIARFGYLLDKAPSQQFGIMYDTLVNTIRAEIPGSVETIVAKAISISTSADRQTIVLSNGETISARLAVIANGLNVGLRQRARYRATNRKRLSFDLDRFRRGAPRPARLPLPGDDVFLGAPQRSHPLY